MAAPHPHREKIIEDILAELDFGEDRQVCLAMVVKKWRTSERTFDRYWKEALSRFNALHERTKKALDEVYIEGKKEALKKAILSKHERQELLTKLATGEILSWRETATEAGVQKLYYYSAAEVKQHIAELNKMDGDYAPTKKDITSGGEKLQAPTFEIILDNGEG